MTNANRNETDPPLISPRGDCRFVPHRAHWLRRLSHNLRKGEKRGREIGNLSNADGGVHRSKEKKNCTSSGIERNDAVATSMKRRLFIVAILSCGFNERYHSTRISTTRRGFLTFH